MIYIFKVANRNSHSLKENGIKTIRNLLLNYELVLIFFNTFENLGIVSCLEIGFVHSYVGLAVF